MNKIFQKFYDKIIWKYCNTPWDVILIVNLSSFQNLQTIITWPQGVSFSLVHNFRLPRSPRRERCVMKNELKIWAIQRLQDAWAAKISVLEMSKMSRNSYSNIFLGNDSINFILFLQILLVFLRCFERLLKHQFWCWSIIYFRVEKRF